jgi:hypothetical protein
MRLEKSRSKKNLRRSSKNKIATLESSKLRFKIIKRGCHNFNFSINSCMRTLHPLVNNLRKKNFSSMLMVLGNSRIILGQEAPKKRRFKVKGAIISKQKIKQRSITTQL